MDCGLVVGVKGLLSRQFRAEVSFPPETGLSGEILMVDVCIWCVQERGSLWSLYSDHARMQEGNET